MSNSPRERLKADFSASFQGDEDGQVRFGTLAIVKSVALDDLAQIHYRGLQTLGVTAQVDFTPLHTGSADTLTELDLTFVHALKLSETAFARLRGPFPKVEKLRLVVDCLDTLSFLVAFPALKRLEVVVGRTGNSVLAGKMAAPRLEELVLQNGPVDISALELPLTLRALRLCQGGLPAFPRLGKAPNLTELDLSDNALTNLEGVEQVPHLTSLVVRRNQLSSLVGVGLLKALKTLDVSKNPLGKLEGVEQCLKLRQLIAADTQLAASPALAGLVELQELDLATNKIKTLPSFAAFPALQTLAVFGNKLKEHEFLETLPANCWVRMKGTGVKTAAKKDIEKRLGKRLRLDM